ncbi:MAG: family 78 glycoside hydrolase catalytic domain [Oscillospiraceae bacterium]|nr:family 78 glycoside hydrolase catalytic domain [Oscillospiraceae bacterium]
MINITKVLINLSEQISTFESRPSFALYIEADREVAVNRVMLEVYESGESVYSSALDVSSLADIQLPEEVHLHPHKTYKVRFRVIDNTSGEESGWSGFSTFLTGFSEDSGWQASFVSAGCPEEEKGVSPVYCFEKTFPSCKKPAEARLYITAKGLYTAFVNGERVGEDVLTPGDMSYQHHLAYQTYIVTDLVQKGDNVLSVLVGDGWYKGYVSSSWHRNYYGDQRELLCELHLRYSDGSEEIIPSDDTFTWHKTNILMSEIYPGETRDMTVPESEKKSVSVCGVPKKGYLHPAFSCPPHYEDPVSPVRLIKTPKGETVIDFGRVMTGVTEVRVRGERGDRVEFRFGDTLDTEGNFYNDNVELFSLRDHDRPIVQKITYILEGKGNEVYRPLFTYQCFRYVKVVDFPGEITLENVTAYPITSFTEQTGIFSCGDELINTLYRNVINTEKATFIDIPVAGPMRAERLGWTGDNQLMFPTAMRTMFDSYRFLLKWLEEVKYSQGEDGQVGTLSPYINFKEGSTVKDFKPEASAIWGDAAVICPWRLYEFYGDKAILSRYRDLAKGYVDYMHLSGDDELTFTEGETFGDWFALDNGPDAYAGKTDKKLLGSFYYYRSTYLLSRILEELGDEQSEHYLSLSLKIRDKLRDLYFEDGLITEVTQAACALAIEFDIAPDKSKTAAQLAELIERDGGHMLAGFTGASVILQALCNTGYSDLALKLAMNRDYPSWLYTVEKGATTVWEHFNGIKEDGTLWSPNMNSFCHLTFGTIADWMFGYLLGIRQKEGGVSYKEFVIDPVISRRLGYARGSMDTVYGKISVSWEVSGNTVRLTAKVPYGTDCEISLPMVNAPETLTAEIRSEGYKEVDISETGIRIRVSQGTHEFVYAMAQMA